MPFDPSILLEVAKIMSQRREQDIQKRLGQPSFGRTLQQGFAQGLGEAPGRMLASLPGEMMASSRQQASFAHETQAQQAGFAHDTAMLNAKDPLVNVPGDISADPNSPWFQPPTPPMPGGGAPQYGPTDPRAMPEPAGPPAAQARMSALANYQEMNRPRYEREIEQMRQAGEMARTQMQGETAQQLETMRTHTRIPGQMAGELGFAGPTGVSVSGAPQFGAGFPMPQFSNKPVEVDERALQAATQRESTKATLALRGTYEKGMLGVREQAQGETERSHKAQEALGAQRIDVGKTAKERELDLEGLKLDQSGYVALHREAQARVQKASDELGKVQQNYTLKMIDEEGFKAQTKQWQDRLDAATADVQATEKQIVRTTKGVQPPAPVGEKAPGATGPAGTADNVDKKLQDILNALGGK